MGRLSKMERLMAAQSALANTLDEQLDESRTPRLRMARAHDVTRSVSHDIRIPLGFDSPESSTILGARYDEAEKALTVRFKRGKSERTASTYLYQGVTLDLWAEFCKAESKGHFFATRIRPNFKGEAQAA